MYMKELFEQGREYRGGNTGYRRIQGWVLQWVPIKEEVEEGNPGE